MSDISIPYSGYNNEGLQVFTPYSVSTIAAGADLTVDDSTGRRKAIRVAANTQYRLRFTDGSTSIEATMPAGVTGIGNNIQAFVFTNETTVEVM